MLKTLIFITVVKIQHFLKINSLISDLPDKFKKTAI